MSELRDGLAHMTALDLVTLAIRHQPDLQSPYGFELARRAKEIDEQLRVACASGRAASRTWGGEFMRLPIPVDVAVIHDEPPIEPDRDAVPAQISDIATARTRTR